MPNSIFWKGKRKKMNNRYTDIVENYIKQAFEDVYVYDIK